MTLARLGGQLAVVLVKAWLRKSVREPWNRRQFLRAGFLALGGLTLPELLAARARSAADTSVILFWMWGGPSQLETYDLKPDAPSEFRGPFKPTHTTVPGLDICELFPLQARQAQRFSLIRSLHHTMSGAPTTARSKCSPAKRPVAPIPRRPCSATIRISGMIASRLRGAAGPGGLPGYVGVPSGAPS